MQVVGHIYTIVLAFIYNPQLNSIMKITTKARMSDVVKFQYGSKGCDGVVHVTDSDRFHVPNSSGR